MKVPNVHEVYMTDQAVTIAIKTAGELNEKAIREILRKNRAEAAFEVVVPAEKAGA